jgi:hypothetical protein
MAQSISNNRVERYIEINFLEPNIYHAHRRGFKMEFEIPSGQRMENEMACC